MYSFLLLKGIATREIANEREMRLSGHATRHPEDLKLAHTNMHGHVPGNRAQGRPRRKWTVDIVRWTGLRVAEAIRESSSRCRWRDISYQSVSTDRHGLLGRRRRELRELKIKLTLSHVKSSAALSHSGFHSVEKT